MSRDRYRPGPAGPGAVFRPTRQRDSWWWRDGVRLVRGAGVIHGWSIGWSGLPSVYDSITDAIPPDGDSLRVLEEFAMSLLRKADLSTRGQDRAKVLTDPGFSNRFPVLWSFLTQKTWEDGSARLTSTLLIFEQDGILKAMLKDKDAGLCLWVAGATFEGLYDALEGALSDPRADWRQDRQEPGQQAKRQQRGR
jgi:hypothetical protein